MDERLKFFGQISTIQELSTAENNFKEIGGGDPESLDFLSMTNSNSRISSMQNHISQQITFEETNSFEEFNSMHVNCNSNLNFKYGKERPKMIQRPKIKFQIPNTGIQFSGSSSENSYEVSEESENSDSE